MKKTLLLTTSLLLVLNSYSQKRYFVEFQTKTVEIVENIDSFNWNQLPKTAAYDNGNYGYILFDKIPSQSIQNNLKNKNLLLLNFINNNTYLFYSPTNISVSYLKSNGVKAIISIDPQTKIAQNLIDRPFGDWAINNNRILVNLVYYKNIPQHIVINNLKQDDIIIKKTNEFFPIIKIAVKEKDIYKLASNVYVKYLEQIAPPDMPDDTRGKSLQRVNAINTKYSGGRHYTGDGIGVMVRDDGNVGPHIDFKGRIDNSYAGGPGGNHGDGVAGIMCGAGNLDPYMEGMAPEASLFVVNYVADYTDVATNTLINNGSVHITNSSYSNGCNAGYTSTTNTVDTQSNNNLNLLHVFSAGNSNNNNCGYGAGDQWGNITGGHKQGKNVIATANIYYEGSLATSSSRGPAYDGRIKPDIAANGQNQMSTDHDNTYRSFGGTSGAAPNIVGIAAVCYESYNQLNGSLPSASLIKATMLNTANDLGNIGPDFKYGWGHVNALRAVKLIEDNRFLNDDIVHGANNTHVINIPNGTKEVRFMLYWNDPAAASGASTALINDLDLTVTTPTNTTLLPWILDHTPDPALLDLPATNGVDHLNNMEQVLIKNPSVGDYSINIEGFNIPTGPQNYFIVYEIITDEIDLTYPIGGESFKPGDTEVIHWDTENDTDDVQIEYSTNNGASWTSIATVPSSDRLYMWNVPNDISGQCKVKLTKNASVSESHEVFYIANSVSDFSLTQVCPDQLIVVCDALTDAISYELYLLGDETMELVATSTNTTITVSITDPNEEIWYAVKAKGDTGWETKRTIAKYHSGGLFNCSLQKDLELTSIIAPAEGISCGENNETVSISLTNTGIDNQQNFEILYQLNSESVVTETFTDVIESGHTVTYEFNQLLSIIPNTNYTLTVWVNLSGDENSTNDEKAISFIDLGNISAPWYQDVELHSGTASSNIENCWSSNPSNTTASYRWNVIDNGIPTPSNNTGPSGAYSGSHYFYTEATEGIENDIAELYTPTINIDALTTPMLTFYYHMYGAAMGNLHVDINSGGTWHNDEIVLTGPQQNDETDSWKSQTLILAAFSGEIQVRFRGIRGFDYSGDIAIDDISIDEAPSCPAPINLSVANISTDSAFLSWSSGYTESNWQIEYGEQGFAHGNGILAQVTTNSSLISSLDTGTIYDVYIRANCGTNPGDDDSTWVGPLSFTTHFDFCNGNHFYDSGGASNEYQNNENITTTISPSGSTSIVTIDFISFNTESDYDFLYIYDGPDRFSTLLGMFSGTSNPGSFTSTHASGSLTIVFTSDQSVTRSGWEVAVTCETIDAPIISVDPVSLTENIAQNETATQDITISNSGNIDLNYTILTTGTSWLSFGTTSGIITPASSTDVAVHFNSTGLAVGVYNVAIEISCNDPNTPILTIPTEFTVTHDLGLNEQAIRGLTYYPNPIDNTFNVKADELLGSVKVYSSIGQLVYSKNLIEDYSVELNLSYLSSGTYFIKVIVNSKINTIKILKK